MNELFLKKIKLRLSQGGALLWKEHAAALEKELTECGITTEWIQSDDFAECALGELAISDLLPAGNHTLYWMRGETESGSYCDGVKYVFEDPGSLDTDYLEMVCRRFAERPCFILETKRCIVRETTEEDVPFFYNIYKDKAVARYLEPLFPTMEEELEYTKNYRERIYAMYGFGIWTVLDRETGQVIGRAGISWRDGYELPEIGFVFGREWQHKGLATEVCSAIMNYGRERFEFDRYVVLIDERNEASIKLANRLGFYKNNEYVTEEPGMILLMCEI